MHSFILNQFNQKNAVSKIQDLTKIDLKKINLKNHPDVIFHQSEKSESIKIDTIRNLKPVLSKNPISLPSYIIIFQNADNLTLPAQNAFLKILEEPNINCFIFLLTHNYQSLVPTIISRCQIVNKKKSEKILSDSAVITDIETLSNQSYSQRMLYFEKFHKDKDQAILWLKNAINTLKNQNNSTHLSLIKNLNFTIIKIKKNVNLKLSLDNLALSWNTNLT